MKNNSFQGNSAQMMAISHYKGPAMVFAGPGSGKTFVIVQRIRYLIEEKNVVPSSILVITFTKAAAIEMQHRFMKITDNSYPDVAFGTFHSIFYQIIKRSGHNNSKTFDIANEGFKKKIITNILLSFAQKDSLLKEELEMDNELYKDVLSEISRIKNSSLTAESCDSSFAFCRCFPAIYEKYNSLLKEFGKIDFDDMILMCYEILSSNNDILRQWQERFKFFLIDEYQDINRMQYNVVELLLGDEKNVFVVGDDDQSIYGFRGSDPGIMLGFSDSFKESKVYNLNVNYRCGSQILNNALLLINENTKRFKKNLKADDSNGKGVLIPLKYSKREIQNKAIVNFALKHKDNLDKIAIICRTNSGCLGLANCLKMAGIPTNLDENSKSFLEFEAVSIVIAYLKFSCEKKKREYFYKIMNKPLRYISRESVTSEIVSETAVKHYYVGNRNMTDGVNKLFSQINMISHMRPVLSVRFIRKEIGIDKIYQSDIEALDEFEKLAREYESTKDFLKEIEERLEIIGCEKNKTKKKIGDYVRLLTMHGSKGLEFDTVWLPDINEGIIPSRGSVTQMQVEEERRMLYVAMTRAKQALIMSYVTGTEENVVLPSRFLRPIKSNWEEKYGNQSSSPSSGSSTSSSNSTSSR